MICVKGMIPGFFGKIKHLPGEGKRLFWEYEKELFTGLLVLITGVFGYGLGRYTILPEKPPVQILEGPMSAALAAGLATPAGESGAVQNLPPLLPVPASAKTASGAAATPAGIHYVGTRTTKKFRRSDCSGISQIAEKNRIYFKTKVDALAAGYVPVKTCPGL